MAWDLTRNEKVAVWSGRWDICPFYTQYWADGATGNGTNEGECQM